MISAALEPAALSHWLIDNSPTHCYFGPSEGLIPRDPYLSFFMAGKSFEAVQKKIPAIFLPLNYHQSHIHQNLHSPLRAHLNRLKDHS